MEELSTERVSQLKMAFQSFDREKKGYVTTNMVGTILGMLGHEQTDDTLKEIIAEVDSDGSGQLSFEEFCNLSTRFLVEEEQNAEAIQQELKEAFRLYDREGNSYITTDVFRDILHELNDQIPPEELDLMIEEVDANGSHTVDFEEFIAVMTGE